MAEQQNQSEPKLLTDLPPLRPQIIDAAQLFRGTREVWIELAGVRYRLRITRRNKLILQK
jgi:hemin uptake protein HemP